jgi:serine/threonine-protein kinase
MKVSLEVIKGPETGRVFEFTEPDFFIVGRSKDAHFRLSGDDPYIGRKHFLLEISPPRAILRDLDSKNKPCVNGEAVLEAELHHADIIEVGFTQMKVTITQEIKTRVVCCARCGAAFNIVEGEVPPELCLKCSKEAENERLAAQQKKLHQVACSCGKDITDLANSDGRAKDLQGVVRYSCERCARSLKKGEEAGKKIDDYEVISVLGSGGMGKVYQVYHKPTGRVLALKQMLNLKAKNLIQRFGRETKYMRELEHPNTIRYINSGETSEGPYLVLEMASFGNLHDLLEKSNKGFMAASEAGLYIADALYGLEFIHKRNIVHRDLKPENILLQASGGGKLVPKITDFGLAKKYNEAGGLTGTGIGMGTVMYMSPEQIRDTRSVREPADIYSMGVTLYHLLTGKFPYNFPTRAEVKRFCAEHLNNLKNLEEALKIMAEVEKIKNPHLIILSDKPIPIQERKPDLPTGLAMVIDRAINKNMELRFQTAAEFRQALQKAL